MNYPVNHSDFTLTKGVLNEVDFLILDIDRKNVLIGEADQLVLRIHKRTDRSIVLTATLLQVGGSPSRFRASIPAEVVDEFDSAFYHYTVCLRSGSEPAQERLLYTDRGRDGSGILEVLEGPLPASTAPSKVTRGDMLHLSGKLVSGAFPGSAQSGNKSGVHTVAVYGNNFSGTVSVEASLEVLPGTDDAAWFSVVDQEYQGLSGSAGFTFTGPYVWIRFKIDETSAGVPTTPGMGCETCVFDGHQQGMPGTVYEWPEGTETGFLYLLYRN